MAQPMLDAPRALARGIDAIEWLLVTGVKGRSHGEFQAQFALPGVTITRLLRSLVGTECVEKGGDGRYRIGPRVKDWLHAADPLLRLRVSSARVLKRLADSTGNSCSLITWDGKQMMVQLNEARENSVVLLPAGERVKHLAYHPAAVCLCSPAEAKRIIASMPRGDRSHARDWWKHEAMRLETVGYAHSVEAYRIRLAAPIRDSAGKTIAAVLLGGTPMSLPESRIAEFGRLAFEAADAIG